MAPFHIHPLTLRLSLACLLAPFLGWSFTLLSCLSTGRKGYYWVEVGLNTTTTGVEEVVRLGGLGWCLDDRCETPGLGYHNIPHHPILKLLPGSLVFHLVVSILSFPLIPLTFYMMYNKNELKWSVLKSCWYWINPLSVILLDVIMISVDLGLINSVRSKVGVQGKVKMGASFWLTIPSLILNLLWLLSSSLFWWWSISTITRFNAEIERSKEEHYAAQREGERAPTMGWLGQKVGRGKEELDGGEEEWEEDEDEEVGEGGWMGMLRR